MTDKLTDSEIVKALEWCVSKFKKAGFVYMGVDGTKIVSTQEVLDLINRLQAENGVYETCNARKDEAIKYLESEVKRLQAENEEQDKAIINALHRIKEVRQTAKAEAYKECIEKVKEIMSIDNRYLLITEFTLNNLYKELVGEDNAKEKE